MAEDGSVLIPFDSFWADLSALPALLDYGDNIDLLIESMPASA